MRFDGKWMQIKFTEEDSLFEKKSMEMIKYNLHY